MKIIIITYYFEPRLGYQEPNLARELGKLGHDVYVVTSNKRYPSAAIYESLSDSIGERITREGFFIEDGIKVVRLKSRCEVCNRTWLRNLEKTITKIGPDVAQVIDLTRFSAIRIPILKWRKRLRFKLIYDDHMVYSVARKDLVGKIFYFLFRVIFRPLCLRQGDAFVGVTEETRGFMHRECGIPLSMIEVVPLGVNHHLFTHDETSRKHIRNQYNISEDDVVFIYAGKVVRDKGPHLLIDAGLKLFGKHEKCKVFVLGDGDEQYINEMKHKVTKRGFGGHIIWHKAVRNKELYKFYSAADVGVWPLQESMTMLEAASCNLPIIVRNSLSLRDRISNDNGCGYREGSIEDLAKCMYQLLIDRQLTEMFH